MQDVRAFVVWTWEMQIPQTPRKPKLGVVLILFFKAGLKRKHWKLNSYLPEAKIIIMDILLPLSLKNTLVLFVHLCALIIPSELEAKSCCLA